MARFQYRSRGSYEGPDLTPFIDIVFNLIIFFMLAWRMGDSAEGAKVQLPETKDPQAREVDDALTVAVTVTAEGDVLAGDRRLPAAELQAFLASERARRGEGMSVVVRADRDVDFERVRQVMRQGAAAGLWKMSFGVLEGQEY